MHIFNEGGIAIDFLLPAEKFTRKPKGLGFLSIKRKMKQSEPLWFSVGKYWEIQLYKFNARSLVLSPKSQLPPCRGEPQSYQLLDKVRAEGKASYVLRGENERF